MARVPIVVGNWKLHNGVTDAIALATDVKNHLHQVRGVDVAVAPVFTALHPVARRLEGSPLGLGAQDCFWHDKGAYTGEVSAALLRDLGCRYVIVGHSERRQHFGELDASVSLKARSVLQHEMIPIVCIGETEKERDAGETFGRLAAQIEGSLADVPTGSAERVVVAYEPVWAIGTGRTATTAQIDEAHGFIRARLRDRFGDTADDIRIQYGGSVKPDNAQAVFSCTDVDGALVGGAALKADSFIAIARAAMS